MQDELTTRVDRLEALVATLAAENTELKARLARDEPPARSTPAAESALPPAEGGAVGRRSLITKGLAAAGAATAGAVLLNGTPAAAVDRPLLIDATNTSSGGGSTILEGAFTVSESRSTNVTSLSVYSRTQNGVDVVSDANIGVNALGVYAGVLARVAPANAAGIGLEASAPAAGVKATASGANGVGVKAASPSWRGIDATGGTFAVYGFGQQVGVYGGAPTFTGDTNVGVQGQARTGVNGKASVATGVGVLAENTLGTASRATGKVAAELAGTETHLRLSNPAGFRALPKDDAFAHQVGDIVTDGYGNLWYCNTAGTPGTWRSLAGPTCAGAFFPSAAPVRAYDSRPGANPANPGPKTKLAAGQTRIINLRTSGAANANASAVLVQVLLVNAFEGAGNFTIWAGGVAKPLANTMVWGGTGGRFSTLAFTNVDANGNVQVNASQSTDLVLDVIGIFG